MPAEMERSLLRRLYVTRPAEEALTWESRLQAAGWPAVAFPLIETVPPTDLATLAARELVRTQAHTYDALMFVSGAAVTHFFRDLPPLPWGNSTRFWAPGPATARRLRDALGSLGIDPKRVDSPPEDADNFDSESLWSVVRDTVRPGARVLIIRGGPGTDAATDGGGIPGAGRDWLIARCREAGAHVDGCVAYVRRAPAWTPHLLSMAQSGACAGHVWLFSSSQAIDHLSQMPGVPDWGQAAAIATHPRIAERARQQGFGLVLTVRPTITDLLTALESGWSRP